MTDDIKKQTVEVQSVSLSGRSIDLALLHAKNPERYPILLESVAKGTLGRFDILFAYPQQTVQLNQYSDAETFVEKASQAFSEQLVGVNTNGIELPFTGGWFAYFSYDYAQVVEPVLNLPQSQFPLASLTRIPAAVIVDHDLAKLHFVAEPDYAHVLAEMQADTDSLWGQQASISPLPRSTTTEEPESKYLQGVKRIKEYILAGDVFQVNLSRLWEVNLDYKTDYLDTYLALRQANPAPFAALACLKDADGRPWQIISSSPERLVRYVNPWVETRPIAGTRKRSDDLAADKALIEELISHPKERAEHIMLIDLERNDLGRICQPGTVEVNELMVIESYEHVHHIVSNVRGKLQRNLNPLDVIHALFPGGTITGCPKIRCMEIVAELEQMPREAYTGSLGYINRDGSLDLNILIRTMIQFEKAGESVIQFRAGAGIVADSEPDFELVETRHKAKGLVNALHTERG